MKRCQLLIFCFVLSMVLAGCAKPHVLGLNTIEKTNDLRPGMNFQEVVDILGKPKASQFSKEQWILKYKFHQYWKGWVPYYVVFDVPTKKMLFGYVDEQEYQRNQMMMMEIFSSMNSSDSSSGDGGTDVGAQNGQYGFLGSSGSSSSSDSFEQDSAGWPGGAYQNPGSSYYDSSTYGND